MNEIIPYKGKINKCKLCGSDAFIYGWNTGIGEIKCSNTNCPNHEPYDTGLYGMRVAKYHYSGKFRKRKSDVIKEWNEDNCEVKE